MHVNQRQIKLRHTFCMHNRKTKAPTSNVPKLNDQERLLPDVSRQRVFSHEPDQPVEPRYVPNKVRLGCGAVLRHCTAENRSLPHSCMAFTYSNKHPFCSQSDIDSYEPELGQLPRDIAECESSACKKNNH